MGVANLWAKARKIDDPYAIVDDGDFEYRILKAYQSREKEKGNRYARWFVAVKSPFTHGSFDMGDTYLADVPRTRELMNILNAREEAEKQRDAENKAAKEAKKNEA